MRTPTETTRQQMGMVLRALGWLTNERNMMHMAAQADYSLQMVAEEHSLQQRDGHGRGQATYMGEDDDDEEEDVHQEGYLMDNLNEEGRTLMIEAEEDVQQARRTLKETRARQQHVTLSRQYFKWTSQGRHVNSPPRIDAGEKGPRLQSPWKIQISNLFQILIGPQHQAPVNVRDTIQRLGLVGGTR